jgi:hypothetical protein
LTQQLRLIYPDTIIWNLLCDQNIDPRKLLDSLRAKGFTLVVSFHTVYELARNFERDEAVRYARGRQLFAYLKQYLDLDIPSTKQLWELIMSEDEAFKKNLSVIDPLATSQESAIEKREVEKLANGIVEGPVKTFLEKRRQFARDTKAQQAARIIESEKLREYLKAISEDELATWMPKETLTTSGVSILYQRFLLRAGPSRTPQYVHGLLSFPLADASRGTVHADLYSNWKCAKDGCNRLDLADDMLHVLQAMYCDLYVTEESNQLRYGLLLLTSRTRVEIYRDRSVPIDQWLLSLV